LVLCVNFEVNELFLWHAKQKKLSSTKSGKSEFIGIAKTGTHKSRKIIRAKILLLELLLE